MEPFLYNTAAYLYTKYGSNLSDCAMVFPNQRAALFFTRYLSELIDKPLWLPKMYTISDLMQAAGGMHPADPISLNFELFRVFLSVTKSKESFDEFYNWGEILLADFDEIDKYMVDAHILFRNVTELKNLENRFDFLDREQIESIRSFWSSFKAVNPSLQQKEFLRIWEALAEIYERYKENLYDRKIAYEGMIFRHVAMSVKENGFSYPEYDKFFITGFNALNECEKLLFDYLKKENRVEFFWDYDDYYISQKGHQAGYFMRENLRRYPHTGFEQDNRRLENCKTDIRIVAVPSNSGQAKLISHLSDMFGDDDPVKTAVILPDESLLIPVLYSLPKEVGEINVTMGYPIGDTPVYGFVMHLLELHKNARYVNGNSLEFHHSDVFALLQHPNYADDRGASAGLIREFTEHNMVYIGDSYLNHSEFGRLVFRKTPRDLFFIDYIVDVLLYIVKYQYNNQDDVNAVNNASFPVREFIYRLYTGVGRLKDILISSNTELRFDTLVKLLQKVLKGLRIPFYGEPLGGVQIMGVLETRALDFDNVICLSVNEGVFPAGKHASSFIPYTLRKAYGLPRNEQHDAVYAYYFYRLLQRTGRMTIIYNTRSEGMFSGEMSRFIYQLKFDRNFKISEKSLVFNLSPSAERPIFITKTPDITSQLKEYADGSNGNKYLSPGAINTYIDCSLRFYFRYIAKYPETDAIKEEIDMAVFGNLLHKSAQLLYAPFIGKQIQEKDINSLIENKELIDKHISEAFRSVLNNKCKSADIKINGMNLIISGVLKTYLGRLLERDRDITPFRIESLEQIYFKKTNIEVDGISWNVNIGGVIDRVDEVDGIKRVVDYKSGSDEGSFNGIDSVFERGNSKRRKAVFQIFLYSWLYSDGKLSQMPVSPVLYQVKKLFGNESFVINEISGNKQKKEIYNFSEYISDFEFYFKLVLSDLFSTDTLFEQAKDKEICRYCTYKKICHR